MIGGYWSKLLRVNLTDRIISVEDLSEEFLKKYLGGSGLGTKILYDEVAGGTDPLGPDNKIIFATGPFQGTGVPGSGKWSVVSKSPLTNTFAITTAGAEWGYRFKKAGYDAVCFEGRSENPVYISIVDGEATFNDALDLWGLDALETTSKLQEILPDKTSVAAIGPAGEKLVAAACIVVDSHSFAGRCGIGAVMGSKNLKAVAVKGTQQVHVHNIEQLKKMNSEMSGKLRKSTKETFNLHGTSVLVTSCEEVGDLPIKYWSGDTWEEGAKKIGAPFYTDKLNARPWPCMHCPIGCHRKIDVETENYGRITGAGAEYESLGMLGSCCLVDDLEAISEANDICNRLGLDTISTGSYVAFTMECFENGLLTENDIGYKAEWGNPAVLVKLVREIGEKSGFGSFFSDGIVPAAKKLGEQAEKLAIHVKGLDLPAHDPRTYFSLAINYATGTRGACHLRGFPHLGEGESAMMLPEAGLTYPKTLFSMDGQAHLAIIFQDLSTALDSLVCCMFMQASGMDMTLTTKFLNVITGWDMKPKELLEIGERVYNLQRLLNVRDGYNRDSDCLPQRMFEPASQGFRANKAPFGFDDVLDEYYKLRGWDRHGVPTPEKIKLVKLAN